MLEFLFSKLCITEWEIFGATDFVIHVACSFNLSIYIRPQQSDDLADEMEIVLRTWCNLSTKYLCINYKTIFIFFKHALR